MSRRTRAALAALAIAGTQLLVAAGPAAAAGPEYFTAALSAASEVPPNATTGTGSATFVIDPGGTSIAYTVIYSGLTGAATAAHIHVGAVGVAGPVVLPLHVGAGSPMAGSLTSGDFVPAGGLTSFAQALDAIRAGGTYVNIHTAANPGGEIRGQIVPAAHAPAFTITADRPEAVPSGHMWDFNDFFPRYAEVTQGTTVLFVSEGFHTITLLPHALSVRQDMLQSGLAQTDTDDVGRNTNGTTHTQFRIAAVMPQLPSQGCGTVASPCAFDGSAVVSSGLSLSGPTPPLAVTFTAPQGLYWFHCRLHPYMTGAIRVVANGQTGTTAAQAEANAAAQIAFDVKAGLATEARYDRTASRRNADGTRTWTLTVGAATRNRRVSLLEFLPRNVDIHAGDTVLWRPLDPNASHTTTFPVDMHGDIVPLCEASGGTDSPATPTVVPPTGPFDFACNGHPADELEFDGGNGVRTIANTSTVSDSGIIAPRQLTLGWGLPQTAALSRWSVRFAANAPAGTYHYVCQIHDGMEGTLTIH